MEIVKVAW